MAGNSRTAEQVRLEIEAEREQLAAAVDDLRDEISEVTNVSAKLEGKLPVIAAGAAGVGFVIAGGIGATMRMLARRSRSGTEKVRFGPFRIVDRD
ncbi:MAG TPA: hypothetical protein VFL41_02450 [Gaiellaceae bacterium]|nr:hypothetical protein [Gaiellaceae bacterium]